MADILHVQDADGDNSDEGVGNDIQQEEGDPDPGETNSTRQYDFLPPLLRLEKHASSDNIFHRLLVGRLILETLPHIADNRADVEAVMAIALKIANDSDPAVRGELIEQVPHITMMCHEDRDRLHNVICDYLLSLIIKFLSDPDAQVRKMSHAALLVMIEQGLIESSAIEEQVCPTVVMLTQREEMVEYHTGAIALMAKMAPLLGGKKTEELFVARFAELCADPVFYVRRACAANIGDMCAVIGTIAAEQLLLGKFVDLCKDDIWGIRKACAEVIMSVSCKCTMATRKQILAPAFAGLLADTSRWVRMSAFSSLGPFISTFADPCIIGLAYNHLRELVVVNPEGVEFRLCTSKGGDGDVIVKYMDPSTHNQPYNLNVKYNAYLSVINKECDNEETANSDDTVNCSPQNVVTTLVEDDRTGIGGPDGDKSSPQLVLPAYESPVESKALTEDNQRINPEVVEENRKEDINNTKTPIAEAKCDSQSLENKINNSDMDNKVVKHGTDSATNLDGESEKSENQIVENTDQRLQVTESDGLTHIHVESFNTFQYWRTPIPDISLDISLDHGKAKAVQVTAKVTDEATQQTYSSKLDVNMEIDHALDRMSAQLENDPFNSTISESFIAATFGSEYLLLRTKDGREWWKPMKVGPDGVLERSRAAERREPTVPLPVQDIVPQILIDSFVTLSDNEVSQQCAFSFPAVIATLGPSNWPLLREAYTLLSTNMQWKVRRTIAASIHEVAIILGEELAAKELVPIFNEIIKDLDEVRIGALKHISEFLKLLRPHQRNSYLPRFQEFILTDNEWNWRFREELAAQLYLCVELFTPYDARKYLVPIGITLLLDKVSAVRHVALSLVNELVRHVAFEVTLIRGVLTELAQQFAHSKQWCRRQMFALLCARMVSQRVIEEEDFARDVLPHLLDLSWDTVPNVRIAVASTIASPIMDNRYFLQHDSPHSDLMLQVMKRLQHDADRDVRDCALAKMRSASDYSSTYVSSQILQPSD